MWLAIGTGGHVLGTRYWTFEFHNWRWISWPAQRLASQGHCSSVLVMTHGTTAINTVIIDMPFFAINSSPIVVIYFLHLVRYLTVTAVWGIGLSKSYSD